ncbi:cytochrome c [Sulfurimicrobium lacus]|uniref:Cytochrome c n=1 Tax=Sulfurimicrobium lacus TaxID=2715678 RepID=A0A6F8VEB8_9PROT|nr:DmsE family decaheme c-type cytochrome [Sulfurimicrobium lacus]BCB27069.1 cytochrome c [Sulfurimicrobium lacus]
MKLILKVLILCAFFGGLGGASSALASDAPPQQGKSATATVALNKDAVCTKCHDESETKPILAIYQTKHGVKADSRTPSCQSCHGDSDKHLHGDPKQKGRASPDILFGTKRATSGSYAPTEVKVQNAACLTCHDEDLNRTHWDGGQHQVNDVACASCHEIHNAHDKVRERKTQTQVCFACHKEQRADTHKISTHPIDANKVICSDCHNPHGSAGPKLLKKNTVNETCFTCHAEKRGPFLFEHQPVNEDCTNCHTPHGSNITPLLKDRPPFLCDECHDGPHNSRQPYGTGAAGIQGGLLPVAAPNNNAVGRSCMNCHVMVHGTNSPAGAFLHR